MAIKISGSTIINDSRILENADKIGIGTANPRYDLDIFASGTPTGIAVSATNTQTTDTNKALSVFNNSNTNNFSVSYKGRVDAVEYYGAFKGTIDPTVPIENAAKIQIHHNSSNSLFNVPFFATGLADDSYQDLQYDNSDSLQYNPSTGRLIVNGQIKQNNTSNTIFPGYSGWSTYAYAPYSHELELDNNVTGTQGSFAGIYFVAGADSDGSKVGTARISAVETGNYMADLAFSTRHTSSFSERLRITSEGFVGIGTDNPHTSLTIYKDSDYSSGDGNTYWMPEGKWTSVWNDFNALAADTDYWVGFNGTYNNSTASVNICLAPNRTNFNGQQGLYISGEATGGGTADFTVGRIIGGNTLGRATTASSGKRATKDELFRINKDGEVGINSTSPREKLDVAAGRIILDEGYQLTWANGTTNRARIHGDSGSNFIVETGSSNTEQLRIDSSGRLLVGTASANSNNKIHARLANGSIANTSNQSVILAENSGNAWITIGSGASSYGGILFADSGSSDIGQVRYNHSTNALEFLTNGGNSSNIRLNITSTGHLLRGGTGQNIGASNARWDTGYFTTLDATNLSGTISAPGSNTQVLFNNNGNVGADAGLTFNSGTDKLTVGGDIKLGGTLFFDDTSGGVEKIDVNGGDLDLHADAAIRFFESDNDKLMFEFDVNTTNDDARIIMEGDNDTYFNHPASDHLGFTAGGVDTLQIRAGEVGINTAGPGFGKLDINSGASQNGDADYSGTNFGLNIQYQSGDGDNQEGNGICFTQRWWSGSGNLIRTGAIVGFKDRGSGFFGGGLKFKVQPSGANPMQEVVRLTRNGNVGVNQSTSPSYRVVINEEATIGTPHGTLSALNPIVYIDAGNEIDHSIVLKKHSTANGDKIGGLIFASSPDASNYSWAGIKAIQDTNAAAESLAFYTSTSNTSAANSPEVMRIKGAMVGIGTDNSGTGSYLGKLNVVVPSTSGASALQIKNSALGSGDDTTTNIVLRSVNNTAVNWAHAQYRASSHDFMYHATSVLKVEASGVTVTGSLNATVTGTAENATNINVAADNSTNATHYPIFVGGATGNQRPNSDTGLTYNPSSGNLSARNFFAILDGGSNTNSQQIVAGDSHGSVALTVNDGYGNANVAFNHRNGLPDSNGSSGRIWCAVDQTTAQMNFELADSAVSGQTRSISDILQLLTNQIKPYKNIIPSADGTINLGTNAVRFGHGYFDNITAANIAGTVSAAGSNKQVLFNDGGDVGADAGLTYDKDTDSLTVSGITTSNAGFMFGTNGQNYLYQGASDTVNLRITSDGPYAEFKDASGLVQIGSASGNLNLSAGGNEKVRIFTDGNVRATSATQYKGFTLVKADGGTVAQLVGHATDNDEGGLNLWDGGTKKVQILANGTSYLNGGNIGINEVSNINGRLHVQHDALAENILYATRYNDQSNDKPILGITEAQMSGMSASGLVIGNHNRDIHIGQVYDGSATVNTGYTNGIRLKSTGEVNIGGNFSQTTDKFQVTGNAKINGDLTITGTLAYEDVTNVVSSGIVTASAFRALGGTFQNTTGTETDPSDVAMMIENNDFIYTNDSTSSKRRLIGKSKTGSTEVIEIGQTGTALIDEIRMTPGNAGFFTFYSNTTERLRIDNDGTLLLKRASHGKIVMDANNKGIYIAGGNDTNVGGNINLFGSTHGSHANHVRLRTGSTVAIEINENGDVGINTQNPGVKFDVHGTLQKRDTAGNQNFFVSESEFKVSQSVSNWSNMNYASTPILAWDYKNPTGDMMYMASGGNTAIANQMALIISDGHGFKVGKSGYDGTDFDVDSSNEYLRINTSGSVNIGGDYTQTSKKLKVTGDAQITGTLTAGNLSFNGTSTGDFTIDGELIISDYIRHKDDTNTHIRFPADDTIRFTTNNAEAVEITPERFIRIGEASPIVLDATNEEAVFIKTDIRNADADAVYALRMDTDDDNSTGTATGDRERGSIFLDFDANNSGGDQDNELRVYNVWNDIDINSDYDVTRGVYNDININVDAARIAQVVGTYNLPRLSKSATVVNMYATYNDTYKTGSNSTGNVGSMYGGFFQSRNIGGATGIVTSMYGIRAETRISDGNTGTSANTNVAVTNAYAVYARMENDNYANTNMGTSGMTALYYGTYATTNGLNNPYGLYIHSSAPNNYIGGNLQIAGDLTVNGTISDGAVTEVAVSYTGRSAPCALPITVTGTTTKTINIPTSSNAFGAKYVQTSEPTGSSVCDGDVWYDTTTGGTGGITITNATEATYRNITFADSSSSTTLKVNDNGRLQVRPSDGAVRVAGDITAFYSSDARLKKNISPIKNALEKVSLISGNTFEWNEKTHNKGKEVGVIAQEVEQLELPGVTTTRQDGTKAVRYEKLVPLLIEAIKELKVEINQLKANASVS